MVKRAFRLLLQGDFRTFFVYSLDFARRVLAPQTLPPRYIATFEVLKATEGKVISGPFAGMTILNNAVSWGDGDIGSKLLGLYECELHPAVEKIISLDPKAVVNLGSAEGFYAVGLARRLPEAEVIAVDIDPRALEATTANAEANGVADRVLTEASVPPDLGEMAGLQAWILDVEGAEVELADPEQFPVLREALMLVELHEFVEPSLLELFHQRFAPTHHFEIIQMTSRDPDTVPLLHNLNDEAKWSLISEGRPEGMRWLFLQPTHLRE